MTLRRAASDEPRQRIRRNVASLTACALLLVACDGSLEVLGGSSGYAPGVASPDADTTLDPEVPSEASLHRLNRLEYNNSLRDLLGTSLRPANNFPPDASVGGFDNVASALSITPTLMDSYVEAARRVVDDAFAARPFFQDTFEENDARLAYTIDRDANRIGGIVRLRGGNVQTELEIPKAAPHTVVVRAQGLQNGAVAAPRMRLTVAGQDFDFDVPLAIQDTPFLMELPAGRHAIALQFLNFEENAAENRGNDILFDRVSIYSDELVEGPGRARVMICDPSGTQEIACTTTIVERFARRAWRRPLSDAERQALGALLATVRAEGESVEDSIKLVLRAVLTSPKFLYRSRTLEDGDSAEFLDPYVIASRLSYFIWSSTPDDRLLTAAEQGMLSTRDGIRDTVRWMLADERAVALADGFAEQWLDLRHLHQASPSAEVYPEFDEAVREAMVRESKLFFLDYVENDAPLASMLQPDFAYRDAILAAHLRLDAPPGEGFQRVAVAPGDRRGVLALSAWLTSRSDSEHSSPIRRGSWIADNMLCAPVPPPPAGLEIGELMEASSGLSVRERLELHRNDPTCAGCHERLDVIGMGFEVYDGVGRYLDEPGLDSLGQLPGGVEFRGAEQMASVMESRTFVSCVSRKLFTYALGRAVGPEELEVVNGFDDATVATLTLADLVTTIVTSRSFTQPRPLQ